MTNLFINSIIIILCKFLSNVENILVNVRHSHNLFKICCNHIITEAGHLFHLGITAIVMWRTYLYLNARRNKNTQIL